MNRKKEYFSIPNLMGYFRIVLLPVFLILYYHADSGALSIAALVVLLISYLTDFLDGKIARKFNMVTEFGKMLDPVADKLTQGVIALALTFQYPGTVSLLVLFLLKEMYMAIMGLVIIRKGKKVIGALWHGKVCTCLLDAGILILLFLPAHSFLLSNILIYGLMVVITVSWAMYLIFHIKILTTGVSAPKKQKKRGRIIRTAAVVLMIVLWFALSVTLPYLKQPEVSEEYKETFVADSYYGEGHSGDRAVIIEDNGEALEERIRLISQAKERIILSTFEMRSDVSGMQMLASLRAAALRGVRVQILLDGFSFWTQVEGNPYFYALEATDNVEIIIYNKANILTPWKAMSRMHDKYIIADDAVYLLGGRNTFDYFLGSQEGHKNYDRDILVYNTGDSGSSVFELIDYFEKMIAQDCCRQWRQWKLIGNNVAVRRAEKELDRLYIQMQEENPDQFERVDYVERTLPVRRISLLSNPIGIYTKEPWVFWSLCQLIQHADTKAVIHTPYIVCNDYMYESFSEICKNNNDITLMTNASKTNGNYFGAVDYALNKEKILDTGMKVLEYSGAYSYHGKSVLIGERISVIGSFNMDMKSVYQDTELMLVIDSEEVNEQLEEIFLGYQQDACTAVLSETEVEELFAEDVPRGTRMIRRIVMWMEPWLRYLM